MTRLHEVQIGKSYNDKSRKRFTGWIWRCACDECCNLPDGQRGIHGPFKTRKAAERDAYQVLLLTYSDSAGTA